MQRKIHARTIGLLDGLIGGNVLARECIERSQEKPIFYSRQIFIEVVKACVGIHEISPNKGVEVELFQKTVSIPPGSSWCMAFLQTCLAYTEKKTGIVSPIVASGLCTSVWSDTPQEQRVQFIPLAGAIAIWKHENEPTKGHTGMILDCDGLTFHAIEGNTSKGAVDLNGTVSGGEGVRFTHRYYDKFNLYSGDLRLLGCLKPF
jgi:hypothetical protein